MHCKGICTLFPNDQVRTDGNAVETVNVSTSIRVETTLYLAQILFARAQPSVQMTISKVGTPSKFGVKRLTFEYLTDYSVFTLNYRLGGQHN